MSMQDPISDLLSQINNAYIRRKPDLLVHASSKKRALLEVLINEGYISEIHLEELSKKPSIRIILKYHEGQPVIKELKRLSKPSLRRYSDYKNLPQIKGGLGIAIVSTNKGLLTDRQAREQCLGGELICSVF